VLGVAFAAWFFWNLVVCGSGGASSWELAVCRHSHWLPDVVGILIIANLIWLGFVIVVYSEEITGTKRTPSDSRVKYYAASARLGYRTLDEDQRDIVFRALEAAAWCLVFTLCVLTFYRFELAAPLALAIIALILRILFGLARWLHDRMTGAGPPPEPPDKPDDRVLNLSAALAEEYAHLYGEAPKRLDESNSDSGFSQNVALNHLAQDTAALCFSGGGIRSASFCLGVAQALARIGLLAQFKYLSTVSGGGYTGSLLTAWAYRAAHGLQDVIDGLKNPAIPKKPNPVAWLRQYCSYLAPRRGVFSVDTWTIVVTYIRNLLLNTLILIPFLATIIALPAFFAAMMDAFAAEAPAITKRSFLEMTFAAAMLSLLVVCVRLRFFSGRGAESERYANKFWSRVIASFACAFAIFLAAGMMLEALGPTLDRTSYVTGVLAFVGLDRDLPRLAHWPVAIGFVSLLIGLVFAAMFKAQAGRTKFDDRATILVGHVAAGLVIGTGIAIWERAFALTAQPTYWSIAAPLVLGPPALLLALASGEAIFLGITSKLNDDYHREWWSRLFGFLTRWSLIWVGLGAVAFAGPWIVDKVADAALYWIVYPAGLLGSGAALARFAFTQGIAGKLTDEKVQSRLARAGQLLFVAAAYAFVALLLCSLAWLTHRLALGTLIGPWPFLEMLERRAFPYSFDRILWVMTIFVTVFTLAAFVVNVNKFSLHSMYRDRLICAFLGASRSAFTAASGARTDGLRENRQFVEREPNPYTDFDRDDNPILWWMSPSRTQKQFPFLVVNGALNLVRSKDLAWQERKAASFTFTPLHVGSHLTHYSPAKDFCGSVGGVTLGTALAISGAAVSPNAGYHSTPILTFLLTLFNARLGWWLGNPRHLNERRKIGPTHALLPIINELAGKTDAESEWVYISDGGHFDNLGIYEMVRRGCRYIVAVDSSADPRFEFDSLGIAIRNIRIDFGISIDLVGSLRIGEKTQGEAGAHCSLFEIGYQERIGGADTDGYLLYIKASHYPRGPNSPVDVRQYAAGMSSFPHEPTSNQFFGESQFESYRALGEWEISKITAFEKAVNSLPHFFTLANAHISLYQSDNPATPEMPTTASTVPPAER